MEGHRGLAERLHDAAVGIQRAIVPTHRAPTLPEAGAGEAHAPGHQHLHPDDHDDVAAAAHELPRERPWTKRQHGLRHPGRR